MTQQQMAKVRNLALNGWRLVSDDDACVILHRSSTDEYVMVNPDGYTEELDDE